MNWTSLVEDYLTQQRELGYLLVSESRYLLNFAAFAEQENTLTLTTELAFDWANKAPSGSDLAIARRFCVLRPFSRYLATLGYDVSVLPTHFTGPTHRRLPPYIFSDLDITQLMEAANTLKPIKGLRPITIKTLIGLLVSTGLRPGEAACLRCQDVDLNKGEVTIHHSKGWEQRVIPLSKSTTDALQAYSTCRKQINPFSTTGFFFEFDNNQPLNVSKSEYAFRILRKAVELSCELNGHQPRLYDLRHTFVCRRLIRWYESGENIDCRIAQLSHYLGHKKVSHTYWYLSTIPELMRCAANRFSGKVFVGGNS